MNNKIERTLAIIKPDAVKKNFAGKIIQLIEEKGIRISAMKMIKLSQQQAEEFYHEHSKRLFFSEIVNFMTSGPIITLCLTGENIVKVNREIIGATNPQQAVEGTIRKLYGENIEKNAIHGSDSLTAANREIAFFFSEKELF
jgi:nucleoside-diphosphate kinase